MDMKTRTILLLCIAMLIVVLGGMYWGLKERSETPPDITYTSIEPENLTIADLMASTDIQQLTESVKAPDFELASIEGEKHRLSQ